MGCIAKICAVKHFDFLVALSYAAPVVPQGAISKRFCRDGICKDAVTVGSVSASMRMPDEPLNFVVSHHVGFRFDR